MAKEQLAPGTWEQISKAAMYDSRISANAFRFLCVLCECTAKDGRCHYSTQTLRKLCGFGSNTTIKKVQDELIEAGWLTVSKGGVFDSGKSSNTYTVHMALEVDKKHRRDTFLTEYKEQQAEENLTEKKEDHKPIKQKRKPTETDPSLLRKLFSTKGQYGDIIYLPEDSEMAGVWKQVLNVFKEGLERGEYTLTEDTFQKCQRIIRNIRDTLV